MLTPGCGNGIKEAGEDCDDGNNVNCDNCPKNCKFTTAPVQCTSTTTRFNQAVLLVPPTGRLLAGAQFCLDYPSGVVALPGTGSIATGGTSPRLTGVSGIATLNDFNNAVQLTFAATTGQAQWTPTISFDLCTGQTAPPATAFVCVVKSATDGNPIDPPTVTCAPQ
jgi:cysteine-rich repeat protein